MWLRFGESDGSSGAFTAATLSHRNFTTREVTAMFDEAANADHEAHRTEAKSPSKAAKLTLSTRVLCFIAGVNTNVAEECPPAELTAHRNVGLSLAATGAFQAAAICAAAGLLVPFGNALTIGLLCAGIMWLIDRTLIIADHHRQGREDLASERERLTGIPPEMQFRTLRRLAVLMPRLGIVVGYSWVVAMLLFTWLFAAEIEDRIRIMIQIADPDAIEQIEVFKNGLDATTDRLTNAISDQMAHLGKINAKLADPNAAVEADPEVMRLQDQIAGVQTSIAELTREASTWRAEAKAEEFGIDNRQLGRGPKSRYAESRWRIAEGELKRLNKDLNALENSLASARKASKSGQRNLATTLSAERDDLETQIASLKDELAKHLEGYDERLAQYEEAILGSISTQTVSRGIFTSIEALDQIIDDPYTGDAALAVLLGIKLFIIGLEAGAITLRLMSPVPSIYAMRLAEEHRTIARKTVVAEASADSDASGKLGGFTKFTEQKKREAIISKWLTAMQRKRAEKVSDEIDSP